ncbi:MAG: Sulfate/thiosulfate import ATP-binding protein CysA [Syntrophorhabdaceae bacterium PtaU1.Bin034]|nr:MAG: Sulfate/thiosulfate import ATP-binding protein CysA [Syntrophorhabdaceae bacterium PtaU1.Bin034]
MSIEINSINKNFGAFAALSDVNLTIPSGELVALLGAVRLGKNNPSAHYRRSRNTGYRDNTH